MWRWMFERACDGALVLGAWCAATWAFAAPPASPAPPAAAEVQPPATEAAAAVSLFDGKSLGAWKPTEFGGEGEVHVADGRIVLEMGDPMTGVTWTGKLPRMNYELELEAMRVEGGDFFCGLTFPVGDDPCTLILGGWGGATVGLSSINGADASENETTTYLRFDEGKWYRVRVRVEPHRIRAWLDDESIVDLDTRDKQLGIRAEVELSRPLGIASYYTKAALRNLKLRPLPAPAAKR